MNHLYLNSLQFDFTPPYNTEAGIDGVWKFIPPVHEHPQWGMINVQSNPMYYSTGGILWLCQRWIATVLQFTDTDRDDLNFWVDSEIIDVIDLVKEYTTINDEWVYRQCLDVIILFTKSVVFHIASENLEDETTMMLMELFDKAFE